MKITTVVLVFLNILNNFPVLVLTQATVMKPIKIECDWDANLMVNGSCSMTPHPVSGGIVNIDVTFAKEAQHIWINHAVYEKIGKNLYKPHFLKVNIDLCDFYNTIKKTILNRFLTEITKDVKQLIHDCPYTGRVQIKDLVLAGGALYLKFLQIKQYRLDYRVYDERNATYFYLKFYGNVASI